MAGRIATDICLWVYYTVGIAILLCAIPVIVIYALLFDKDEEMRLCNTCGAIRLGGKRCTAKRGGGRICGSMSSCYVPNQEEIEAGRELIQEGWTTARERKARLGMGAVPHVEIEVCHQHQRGRRVVRERSHD